MDAQFVSTRIAAKSSKPFTACIFIKMLSFRLRSLSQDEPLSGRSSGIRLRVLTAGFFVKLNGFIFLIQFFMADGRLNHRVSMPYIQSGIRIDFLPRLNCIFAIAFLSKDFSFLI